MVEYIDPRNGKPFPPFKPGDGNVPYPTIDGIPVLTLEPRSVLAHIPRNAPFPDVRRAEVPDPITPHLQPSMLGAPDGLGAWFKEIGDGTPDSIAAAFGARYAPPGPALDVGCGVGAMTRRMATSGRPTWAFDWNPDAVVLAKRMLTGALPGVLLPTHKGGLKKVKVPIRPITQNLEFCIAEAAKPPFAHGVFAWVNVNARVDELGDNIAEVLVACAELLMPGGLLTFCTQHSYAHGAEEGAHPPEDDFLAVIGEVGLNVIDQKDRIPTVIRHYDRRFEVRFVHCIVARR